MSSDYNDREVTFEILEHIGVLATFSTGWRKEINLVSWNGAVGKYDIREWDPSHERMSRGITLKENEMRILLEVMRRRRKPAHRVDDRPGPMRVPAGFTGDSDERSMVHDVGPETRTNAGGTDHEADYHTPSQNTDWEESDPDTMQTEDPGTELEDYAAIDETDEEVIETETQGSQAEAPF